MAAIWVELDEIAVVGIRTLLEADELFKEHGDVMK